MSCYSRRVRPVPTVEKRLLPPGTTQVSSSKAGRLLQRPVGDLTGVDAVGRSPRPSASSFLLRIPTGFDSRQLH